MLDENNLYITTATETDERVRKVFPNGVASEDARATIGTAPPPPSADASDPASDIVVALDLAKPVDLATVRAAVRRPCGGVLYFVRGSTASGVWHR